MSPSTPPRSQTFSSSSSNPNTVSQRPHTYVYSSPSTPPQASISRFPDSYPFPESPTRTPPLSPMQERHQAQLANYHRDPPKSQRKHLGRFASLKGKWSNPLPYRRLSAVAEHGGGGDDKYRREGLWRRGWRLYILPAITGRTKGSKSRKYLIYFITALTFYFILYRPLSNPSTPSDKSSPSARTQSSTSKTQSLDTTSRKPLHARPKLGARPALPGGVTKRTLPDHPIQGGLLHVDPESQVHPIYQLIRDAREEWDRKVVKQSRTLKEAVEEYRKRYGMQPPKGFDKWWEYVCDHDIPLPDEYDRITQDLRPYHALSPKDLRSRITSTSNLPDTYTLKVKHGSVRTSSSYDREVIMGADERLQGQVELLRPVSMWLDDFEAVYSVHDTPTNFVGWDHKRELEEHVEEGEWWDEHDEIDLTLRGWAMACPPNSPIRNYNRYSSQTTAIPSTSLASKTFISHHPSLMDICSNPSLIPLHGVLAGKNPVTQPLTPIFSLSKTNLHADILGVPTEQWVDVDDFEVPSWGQRGFDKLLWRGSNTGAYYDSKVNWRTSHRARLLRLGNTVGHGDEGEGEGEEGEGQGGGGLTMLPAPRLMRGQKIGRAVEEVKWGEANRHYMDLAFTGEPLQCDREDGTCDDIHDEYRWEQPMTHQEALSYKYVVDVDGNAWSARFKRLLSSGSLVFKATIMPEWWNDRIQPWVHYVPVKIDYSDIYDSLAFFRGDTYSRGSEPDLARDIAAAGREWSATHWRKEDMTAYVFRLYLEWARLYSDKRRGMDFVYDVSMERQRTGA